MWSLMQVENYCLAKSRIAPSKKSLAILWSLQHWEHFIYGRHVVVYSDHRPLQWLRTMANHNSRLQRWSLMLEKYDIETVYKRGVENTNCDELSRLDVE